MSVLCIVVQWDGVLTSLGRFICRRHGTFSQGCRAHNMVQRIFDGSNVELMRLLLL